MEQELSRVVDALPGLVWTSHPDGRVDFLNRRWCEYTGHSADEDLGWGWKNAIHPDDLPGLLERWQLSLVSGSARNAADAMSDVDDLPRQLTIRTERDEEDCVRVSVGDVGVGIEPQGADRLFDAFYTTRSGGMGIGLSVSRSIIENHRGRLWATPNDGPGATFFFSIPRGSAGVTSAHIHEDGHEPAIAGVAHVARSF
jgi:hypothetical protein